MVMFLQFDAKEVNTGEEGLNDQTHVSSCFLYSHDFQNYISVQISLLRFWCIYQLCTGHFHLGGETLNLTCPDLINHQPTSSSLLLFFLPYMLSQCMAWPSTWCSKPKTWVSFSTLFSSFNQLSSSVSSASWISLESVHFFYLHFP